ncbi:MAG: hypothetical protein OCU22_03660 [Canidatus Methanoxibalbensis ujae]|nr:hypothetical protein [Candidatus Methanoxibalbensis ujae]
MEEEGVVRKGEKRGVEFEIITSEEFDKRYQRYGSLWESDNCVEVVGYFTIHAVFIWGAPATTRKIVIEDQKDEWKKCRYIMWWLGYTILGKCSSDEKEKPEWLYDEATYYLHCQYDIFGLLPMKWELRVCDEETINRIREGKIEESRLKYKVRRVLAERLHIIQLEADEKVNVEILANKEKVCSLSPFKRGKIVLLEIKDE